MSFVSRAGAKLEHALIEFGLDVSGKICADLGCSTGGFTDCLLQRRAAKVYCVDTGYGVLEYKLRIDSRVVVMERTNALHVVFPEKIDFISIDVGWTRQSLILPHALELLAPGGNIVSLVKPHYEAKKAHLQASESAQVFAQVIENLRSLGITPQQSVISPILGEKGGNVEYLIWVRNL
jgi:23S rRNA (cytidine1920-2'-O)/16S rRNA (cytidine1409-2'-O)-methyltransferase